MLHGYVVVSNEADAVKPPLTRQHRIVVGWRVEPTFYEYRILGRTGTELLVFHHEPGMRFRGPDHPHIHVSATVVDQAPNGDAIPYDLDKRHIATGTVALSAVVRMLIEEFGAEGRGDWHRILSASDERLA